MKGWSEQRLDINRELYSEKKPEYAVEFVTPPFSLCRLSPDKFAKKFPSIVFVEVPLEDGMHWLFHNTNDLDRFRDWAKSNGFNTEGEANECR